MSRCVWLVFALVCVPLPISKHTHTLNDNVGEDKCTRNVFFIIAFVALKFQFNLGAVFHGCCCCCRRCCCCCCYAIIIIITPLGTFCYGQCRKINSYSDALEFLTHVISGKIAVLFLFLSLDWVFRSIYSSFEWTRGGETRSVVYFVQRFVI